MSISKSRSSQIKLSMRATFTKKYKILLAVLLIAAGGVIPVFAQSVYQPYTYQFYQKFSSDLYSTQTRIHTSIKPYFADDSLIKHTYDSLMKVGTDTT
jgi:hypothetical protein